MKSSEDLPRYRFGPLERRGVLVGLRAAQLVVLGSVGVIAVLCLRALPSAPGALAAVTIVALGVATTFLPIAGRGVDEWIPVILGWLLSRRRFVSQVPVAGVSVPLTEHGDLPSALSGLAILAHESSAAPGRIGVAKDHRAGTYTGVLAVRGRSFALLDAEDKARRLSSWAGILSGLAREGGLGHRIQWVERTVPDPGDGIGEYLKDNLTVPLDSPIARSYLEVVDEVGPVTQDHEVFVALQIHAGRAGRAIKVAGGGDFGACEVLRREMTALATGLVGTEVAVEGALTPRLLAHALRTAFDPASRAKLAAIAGRSAAREGTSPVNAAPIACEESWNTYRTDSAWHSTYWIAEWPRVDADPDFLAPLLLRSEHMRTVAVTMQPISTLKAIRSVEAARTSAAADEELRAKAGFVTTTRRRREQESLAEHERDLSSGHAFYRFAGFITVSASTRAELEVACGEIEEAAGRCFLDLRRLCGQQAAAFTYGLPLARGLK